MSRMLLTGANGFIGRNVQRLLCDKYHIIPLTRTSRYDISCLESLMEINDVDVVVHAAAKTFVPESFDKPYEFYKFNIESTLNIAEYCRRKSVKKLIYLNSYMYGDPKYLPIDELHPVSFHSPYNKSKYIAENILLHYLDAVTEVTSLRMFNVYGKCQSNSFLIPSIINQARNAKEIIVNDLVPKRDFIYVEDVVSLINKVVDEENSAGVFNVASGKSHSVEELINLITEILAVNIKVGSTNKRRKGEVMDCFSKIDSVKKRFNWEPKYDLKSGLEDYISKNIEI